MPSKDFQRDFAEHQRLLARAKEHARRIIEYTEAERLPEARIETDRAATCLKKAMAIEKKFKVRNPHEDGE